MERYQATDFGSSASVVRCGDGPTGATLWECFYAVAEGQAAPYVIGRSISRSQCRPIASNYGDHYWSYGRDDCHMEVRYICVNADGNGVAHNTQTLSARVAMQLPA